MPSLPSPPSTPRFVAPTLKKKKVLQHPASLTSSSSNSVPKKKKTSSRKRLDPRLLDPMAYFDSAECKSRYTPLQIHTMVVNLRTHQRQLDAELERVAKGYREGQAEEDAMVAAHLAQVRRNTIYWKSRRTYE